VAVEACWQHQPAGRATIQAADQLAETEYGKRRRHRVDGRAIAQVRPDDVGNVVTSGVADKSHGVAFRISPSPDWHAESIETCSALAMHQSAVSQPIVATEFFVTVLFCLAI
jgi:hypothetical protein